MVLGCCGGRRNDGDGSTGIRVGNEVANPTWLEMVEREAGVFGRTCTASAIPMHRDRPYLC